MKKVHIGHIGVMRGDRITLTDVIKLVLAGDIKIIEQEDSTPIMIDPIIFDIDVSYNPQEKPKDVQWFIHQKKDKYLERISPNKKPPVRKKYLKYLYQKKAEHNK